MSGLIDMCKFLDMTGMRFGKLKVLSYLSTRPPGCGKKVWCCTCDCGAMVEVRGDNLRRGKQNTCGNRTIHPTKNRYKEV